MSESNVHSRGSVARVSLPSNPFPCAFEQLIAAHRQGQDNDKIGRGSTDAMASVTPEPSRLGEVANSPLAPTALKLTAETLSQMPQCHDVFKADGASSKDGSFHGRQIGRPQGGELLTVRHNAALTHSLLQRSDIMGRVATLVDKQPKISTDLQTYMKADPPVGILENVRANIGPDQHSRTPVSSIVEIDEEYTNEHVHEAYATAYQLRSPGTTQLEPGVVDSMRREAAMDDALFRPSLWQIMPRAIGRPRNEEKNTRAIARKPVRKRKREIKESH
jgi:hypothetical protein